MRYQLSTCFHDYLFVNAHDQTQAEEAAVGDVQAPLVEIEMVNLASNLGNSGDILTIMHVGICLFLLCKTSRCAWCMPVPPHKGTPNCEGSIRGVPTFEEGNQENLHEGAG
jgi:hypothetical protein